MKYLNGKYYVDVKVKRYGIHATENKISRLQREPNFLKVQYQVQRDHKLENNRKMSEMKTMK